MASRDRILSWLFGVAAEGSHTESGSALQQFIVDRTRREVYLDGMKAEIGAVALVEEFRVPHTDHTAHSRMLLLGLGAFCCHICGLYQVPQDPKDSKVRPALRPNVCRLCGGGAK